MGKVGQATTASISVRVRVLQRDPDIQDTTASAIRKTCLPTLLLSECAFGQSPSASCPHAPKSRAFTITTPGDVEIGQLISTQSKQSMTGEKRSLPARMRNSVMPVIHSSLGASALKWCFPRPSRSRLGGTAEISPLVGAAAAVNPLHYLGQRFEGLRKREGGRRTWPIPSTPGISRTSSRF